MTTGSWIEDHTHPWVNPQNGAVSGTYGSYEAKTWFGGDSPPLRNPIPKRIVINRWIPNGRKRDGSTRWKFSPVSVRNPAYSRPKRPDPHPYTMSYVLNRNPRTSWQQYDPPVPETGAPERYGNPQFTPLQQYGFLATEALKDRSGNITSAVLSANDLNDLINDLGNSARGSSFNPAVSMAEAFESLDMVTDTATRLGKSIESLRRGDGASAWRYLVDGTSNRHTKNPLRTRDFASDSVSTLSKNWLSLQLGWKPLLSDVKSAAEAAASCMTDTPHTMKFTVQKTKGGSARQVVSTVQCVRTAYHRRRIIAYLTEDVGTLGFALQSPELVAWEKLPYSFVLDYMLPIGDWLEARANVRALKGKFVISDVRSDISGPVSTGYSDPLNGRDWYYIIAANDTLTKQFDFVREVTDTLVAPRPTFVPLAEAASVKHCLTSLALMANRFLPGSKALFRK
jgi:hypothetical protein